jgi:hypothetical protein
MKHREKKEKKTDEIMKKDIQTLRYGGGKKERMARKGRKRYEKNDSTDKIKRKETV